MDSKSVSSWRNPRGAGLATALLLLVGVLSVLFFKSYLPGYTLFSNDGPLGTQMSASHRVPDTFSGGWQDLNTIGFREGGAFPNITYGLLYLLGPLGYSKFYVAFALLFLGLGAWCFFRQLQLAPLACVLGALAASLNSGFFSAACWGVAMHDLTIGLSFFALAALVDTSSSRRWLRVLVAAFAVGLGVSESADIGVIFSLCVTAFVIYQGLTGELEPTKGALRLWVRVGLLGLTLLLGFALIAGFGTHSSLGRFIAGKIGAGKLLILCALTAAAWWAVSSKGPWADRSLRSGLRLAGLALPAFFVAAQTMAVMVSTQITGVVGMQQDTETKARRWAEATQWSLPKAEAIGVVVPGLFGYRMDTPNDMEMFGNWFEGGMYWGTAGSDPAWDQYFESGKQGPPPARIIRFTGGGNYAGVLVILVAVWAALQGLRKKDSIFPSATRRWIWFWSVLALGSLLLAFGRFAPFYRLVYLVPYVSTFRNPAKFMHLVNWALVVLFAYGVHGLWEHYLRNRPVTAIREWWHRVSGVDRRWTIGSFMALGLALVGWMAYASNRASLEQHLQEVQIEPGLTHAVAGFSLEQVGLFVLLFALAAGLMVLILSGALGGKRAKWAGALLLTFVVLDLGRANLPWLVYWDYNQKYATNPVIDRLRDKPYEHRVAILPFQTPPDFRWLGDVYKIEWAQHVFLYYNVQSLDMVQMRGMPEDLAAFDSLWMPRTEADVPRLLPRHWQLTNTRYLLGPTGFLDVLNQRVDPTQHRFRVVEQFDLVPKPGISQPTKLEELTAFPTNNGKYALFEFTGALPRARLYSNWQLSTNDPGTLEQLASPEFHPENTVLVAGGVLPPSPSGNTNENTGKVEFTSYAPKDIVLRAEAPKATVLLLNDRYDPNWKVAVDGKTATLLRCNYLMRGVFLTPGLHRVEFQFKPPMHLFYVSLLAVVLGLALCGFLLIVREAPAPPSAPTPAHPPQKTRVPQAADRVKNRESTASLAKGGR